MDNPPPARSVKIPSDTVDDLKKVIKAKQSPDFDDIVANNLMLWPVFVTDDDDDDEQPILLTTILEKKKLKATHDLSDVFGETLPKKTIHIIVRRPTNQGNADAFVVDCFPA